MGVWADRHGGVLRTRPIAAVLLFGLVGTSISLMAAVPSAARPHDRALDRAHGAAVKVGPVARNFVETSDCPVTFRGAKPIGRVTRANRLAIVKRVLAHTELAVGSGGRCAEVVSARQAAPVGRQFRATLRAHVTPGNRLVRLRWQGSPGEDARTTLAVVNRRGEIRYEPLMASFTRTAPVKVPSSPTARLAPASVRTGPAGHTIEWQPWRARGRTCVAVNGYGKCVVHKKVFALISTDDSGHITDHKDAVVVEGAWGYRVSRDVQSRSVVRDGVDCRELTIEVSWTNPYGTHSGRNKQVYTLCADGTGYYHSE